MTFHHIIDIIYMKDTAKTFIYIYALFLILFKESIADSFEA